MNDEKLNDEEMTELNLMLIVDSKFWFPLRIPHWACILDSGSWGLELMTDFQRKARKARGSGNPGSAKELDATVEEIRAWLVRRSGLVASLPDLASRQRINPQAICGEKNMRRYIHRLLDIAKPAPMGATMDVLLLADLEGDAACLYSILPEIARHVGQYVQGEQVSQECLREMTCAAICKAMSNKTKGEKSHG